MFLHVLPRFDVLNDILRQGQIVNVENQMFEWQPFELSNVEYENLTKDVLSHPEWKTEIDDTFSGAVNEWSHWALVRALNSYRQKRD